MNSRDKLIQAGAEVLKYELPDDVAVISATETLDAFLDCHEELHDLLTTLKDKQ